MADSVLLEITEGIAIVTLNRPEAMNAVNYALLSTLPDVLRRVEQDPEVGCVVLTGAGKAFCAGGDIKKGASPPKTEQPQRVAAEPRSASLRRGAEASRLLHEMPKPTIAMINGPVAGAGIGLAGACDIRFAGPDATFMSAYQRIGASGDYGATWHWTRILGTAGARELFILGEKYTPEQALDFGLYTRIYGSLEELEEASMSLAGRLAGSCGTSWALLKANLRTAEHMTLADHLDIESTNMGLSTVAHWAMVKAQKEK